MDLILLAGGECPEEIAAYANVKMRSELLVDDRTMCQVVVDAFQPYVKQIIVVGGPVCDGVDAHLPGQSTFTEAIKVGLEAALSENVLLATADLPFLKPEHVKDFIDQLSTCKSDFVFTLIPVDYSHILFKKFKRTSLKTAEGRFTGGNIGMAKRESLYRALNKIDLMYTERKNPLKYFLKTQFGMCVRAIVGQILPPLFSVKRDLQPAATAFLGKPFELIILNHPEIGTDIDNLEQYKALENFLTL